MQGNEMLLAIEELDFPAEKRQEIIDALKSSGLQRLGHLVSPDFLQAKGLSVEHVSAVTRAMYRFGLWIQPPQPVKGDKDEDKSCQTC